MSCGVMSTQGNKSGVKGNTMCEGQQGEGETGTAAATADDGKDKNICDKHQGRIRSTKRELKRVTRVNRDVYVVHGG